MLCPGPPIILALGERGEEEHKIEVREEKERFTNMVTTRSHDRYKLMKDTVVLSKNLATWMSPLIAE